MNTALVWCLLVLLIFYASLFIFFGIFLIIALAKNMHTLKWVKGPEIIDINGSKILLLGFDNKDNAFKFISENNIRVSYVYNTLTDTAYIPVYNGLCKLDNDNQMNIS